MSWYTDLDTMYQEDAYLQSVYRALQKDMPSVLRSCIRDVHVYPSLRCTYTIAKRRIFVRVRDDRGEYVPPCAIRHILIHEIAHVVNRTIGHDQSFDEWVRWIQKSPAGRGECPRNIPPQFNPCHK